MRHENDVRTVIIITKDSRTSSFITDLLVPALFHVSTVADQNEAKRILIDKPADIIIVDSGDGIDAETAVDLSESPSTVLLLVPGQVYDQISFRVETYGVITIAKPLDRFLFYTMLKVACAVQNKIRALTVKTMKLEEKMEEIRLVNRAKMILMQNLTMTEHEAHRYIEKEAMDRCVKNTAIAENVIRTYGS